MKSVKVLGLGSYGFALLHHLDRKHFIDTELTGFTRNAEVLKKIMDTRKHPQFPDTSPLSSHVSFESDMSKFVMDTDILIVCVSSNAIAQVINSIKYFLTKPLIIVNTAKALDETTGDLFSKVVSEILYDKKHIYATVAGATIAKDLISGIPLGINIGCLDSKSLEELTELFQSKTLWVYPTHDVRGVEYAAAFKNVISIFSGVLHGMGYSLESEIFFVTQLAGELKKVAVDDFRVKPDTFSFSSPCWGNDIWMSCASKTRNREFGVAIGKGRPVAELLVENEAKNKTLEGIFTIQSLSKIPSIHKYFYLSILRKLFEGEIQARDIRQLLVNDKN